MIAYGVIPMDVPLDELDRIAADGIGELCSAHGYPADTPFEILTITDSDDGFWLCSVFVHVGRAAS